MCAILSLSFWLVGCRRSNNLSKRKSSSSDVSQTQKEDELIKSIYRLYQQNGGPLSYEEWLASIKGADGKDGRDGVDGKDGVSIVGVEINNDYCLIVTLSNGETINAGRVTPQENQYTVTFLNFGEVYETASVEEGKKVTKPSDPENQPGRTFVGWYYGELEWLFPVYTVTENLTLNAQWELIQYELNVSVGEGASLNGVLPATYTVDDEIMLPTPTRPGYSFQYWVDGNNQTISKIHKGSTGNISITAIWEQIQYSLNVTSSNVNNGTVEILEGTGFALENTRVLATPLNDNVFVGWYYGSELVSEEAEYDFIMPYHDYELTAVFASPEALKGEIPFVNPATQTVVFGSYPQQFVEDETVATALSGLSGGDVSGTILEYDENGDSILEKYYVSEVKKSRLTESGQTMDEGIGYFKIQPLVWKILETSENTYTIMTDKVIDGTCWRKPVGEQLINNYEYSDIRSYINSNFINLAFNSTQQELINVTHVDNSINTTSCTTDQCICGDTDDKVFLLSYRDIQEKLWKTDSLIGITTDFARAQNVEMSALDDSYGLAYWGSRSPDPSHLNVSVVTPFGRLEGYKYAYDYICGVRPAINITLS